MRQTCDSGTGMLKYNIMFILLQRQIILTSVTFYLMKITGGIF